MGRFFFAPSAACAALPLVSPGLRPLHEGRTYGPAPGSLRRLAPPCPSFRRACARYTRGAPTGAWRRHRV